MRTRDLFDRPGAPNSDAAQTVLLVQPAPSADETQALLQASGYRVQVAEGGTRALRMLGEVNPDAIVLDLLLPDVDGLVLCSELRERAAPHIPIIALSGARRQRDAALAMRLGADASMPTPFDIHELHASIQALLRRHSMEPGPRPSEPDAYRVGDLVIGRARRFAVSGGEALRLSPTEYRLLLTLASRPDEAVSREELAQRVWGYLDPSHGRTIDMHIARLRDKLESARGTPLEIVAVRGSGYQLQVSEDATPSPSRTRHAARPLQIAPVAAPSARYAERDEVQARTA